MPNLTDPETTVGKRIVAIRRRRGITQQILADRLGLSRGAVAKYEAGERPVDSRKLLLDLAEALNVSLADLTGHDQDRLDPTTAGFHAAVPAIETVLWSQGNITDTAPPQSLEDLTAAANYATKLRVDCDYVTLGPMLAPMLTDAYQHIHTTPENEKAWDVFGVVAYGVASALRARGYHALAWTAAQEAERAADNVDGAAPKAAAAFSRGQILLSRPGALPAALATATSTAARIASDVRTIGDIETYGMLHLNASLAAATLGQDPTSHLVEAAEQASRLATASPGTSVVRNDSFVPANVALWRMSAAMERGEPGEVLHLASTLTPADLPNEGRRAQYFVEVGRALGMKRQYEQSLNALLRAELVAPQHVRTMVPVRELAGHMMRLAKRDLARGALGQFAQRVGVVPS